MFDIKKYFGHRSNTENSTAEDITREGSSWLRPGNPFTTSFNRKLVIGLVGFFVLVFSSSMFYGMTQSGSDKKSEEDTRKDKKIANVTQTSNHLDKLPSNYGEKLPNKGISGTNSSANETNPSSQPLIQDSYTSQRMATPSVNYTSPRQQPSYQPVDYNSPPPIPGKSQVVLKSGYDSSEPAVSAVNSTVNKEEQELAEARKSPIRFNLK